PTGRERLAEAAVELLRYHVVRDIGRQVPQVLFVPEPELLRAALLDVLAHVVRQAKPGQSDALALALLLELLSRCLDTDGRRGNDPLELRIGLQQRLGLLRRVGRIVVPVRDLDELPVLLCLLLPLQVLELALGVLVPAVRRGR